MDIRDIRLGDLAGLPNQLQEMILQLIAQDTPKARTSNVSKPATSTSKSTTKRNVSRRTSKSAREEASMPAGDLVPCPSPFCDGGRYYRPNMLNDKPGRCIFCKGMGLIPSSKAARWKPSHAEREALEALESED